MNSEAMLNCLKYIDDNVHERQCAGYDLSEADLAYIWRSASGDAREDEIAAWTASKASQLGSAEPDPARLHKIRSAASLIVCGMEVSEWWRRRLPAQNVDFG